MRVDPFAPAELAGMRIGNRIVMAPMTRCRAGARGTATALMAEYYAQRAGAGLIITEGIHPSPIGKGYPGTPGLHTREQRESWRLVTDAVHAAGGRIAAQLMHAGRVSHPSVLARGEMPVGPSPVRPRTKVFTEQGMQDIPTPRELDSEAIARTIEDFAEAASAAIDAGFDGVEIHGANGYLVHQFLAPDANRRADRWGGGPSGRIRFAVDLTSAVVAAIGSERVGMRISPGGGGSSDIHEDRRDLAGTYLPLIHALDDMRLAWLHVVDQGDRALVERLRAEWHGTLILNPGVGADGARAAEGLDVVEGGKADLVSYAALFLANPDLPARLRSAGPYNVPDRATYYGGSATGYTDYPALGA